MDVLGLGTPEIRRQVQAEYHGAICSDDEDGEEDAAAAEPAGDESKKQAVMEEPENEVRIENIEVVEGGGDTDGADVKNEPSIRMMVHITPRHPKDNGTEAGQQWPSADSPYKVLTHSPPSNSIENSVHDILHALIRDALYDFRREVKTDMLGLHLDLVKMGRSWRKEMKETLDSWSEELRELREENGRLRREMDTLRTS